MKIRALFMMLISTLSCLAIEARADGGVCPSQDVVRQLDQADSALASAARSNDPKKIDAVLNTTVAAALKNCVLDTFKNNPSSVLTGSTFLAFQIQNGEQGSLDGYEAGSTPEFLRNIAVVNNRLSHNQPLVQWESMVLQGVLADVSANFSEKFKEKHSAWISWNSNAATLFSNVTQQAVSTYFAQEHDDSDMYNQLQCVTENLMAQFVPRSCDLYSFQ